MSDKYIKKIYSNRFCSDLEFRKKMWNVLCSDFFQKYISVKDTVVEVGAGYCEFINNIKAHKKIAIDINEDIKKFANNDVEVILSNSTAINIPNNVADVVFVSNFFEHITKEDIKKTLNEINRILKDGGKLLILQPNIRFCYKDYWMFFDHITPLDDRSLIEVCKILGFKVKEKITKFLPYTTKSILPKSILLLKLYLKFPILWIFLGKQSFLFLEKITKEEL
ncbi:MAG: class I SAM-dependent methyltransferase [Elusimicrobiales bacterium]|nr:class I SAM-dependent methyltransferase [Elusimicrobiales bacterium]